MLKALGFVIRFTLMSTVTSPFFALIGILFGKWIDKDSWVVDKIYNASVDLIAMLLSWALSALKYALYVFPENDLSNVEANIETFLDYFLAFNDILPLVELFACVSFLTAYYICFTGVRLTIKLIPGLG